MGFLGPDTTEVIIKLLSVQWNSHELTSSVKRNKLKIKSTKTINVLDEVSVREDPWAPGKGPSETLSLEGGRRRCPLVNVT